MRKIILISGVILLLAMFVIAWNFASVTQWDGYCLRDVKILVLDASSLQPIPRAKVAFVSRQHELMEKYPAAMEACAGDEENLSRLHPSAETDSTGRCRLRVEFPASGTQTLFSNRGSFGLAGKLDVERPGAPSVRIPLCELTDTGHYPISYRSPIDVTVRLQRGTTHDQSAAK